MVRLVFPYFLVLESWYEPNIKSLIIFQPTPHNFYFDIFVKVLMIPLNGFLAATSRKYNRAQMKNKDQRSKLMDELLSGIKVIKLYAWEAPILEKINTIRNAELAMLKKIAYLTAFQTFTWSCTPFLVTFTSFCVYAQIGEGVLTSSKIFVSLSLFNLLQFPMAVLPNVISACVEASVSLNR